MSNMANDTSGHQIVSRKDNLPFQHELKINIHNNKEEGFRGFASLDECDQTTKIGDLFSYKNLIKVEMSFVPLVQINQWKNLKLSYSLQEQIVARQKKHVKFESNQAQMKSQIQFFSNENMMLSHAHMSDRENLYHGHQDITSRSFVDH